MQRAQVGAELVEQAGVEEQDGTIETIAVREEVRIDDGDDRFLMVRPFYGLRVTYELVYPPPVGEQTWVFTMHDEGDFRREIAPDPTDVVLQCLRTQTIDNVRTRFVDWVLGEPSLWRLSPAALFVQAMEEDICRK